MLLLLACFQAIVSFPLHAQKNDMRIWLTNAGKSALLQEQKHRPHFYAQRGRGKCGFRPCVLGAGKHLLREIALFGPHTVFLLAQK